MALTLKKFSRPWLSSGDDATAAVSSPIAISNYAKEEEILAFPGRKSSPSLAETGLRGISRGALANQTSMEANVGNVGDAASMVGRVFPPPSVPGIQWRPGSSFQNQNETVQIRGRTEIGT